MHTKSEVLELFGTGLGDVIAMSGLAETLSHQVRVCFSSLPEYAVSMQSFFIHCPNVEVLDPDDVQFRWRDSDAHNRLDPIPTVDCDRYEALYRDMDVPYGNRWSHCPIPRASLDVKQNVVGSDDYIFMHDDPSRGLSINRSLLPRCNAYLPGNRLDISILVFRDAIENAREVHVIDSCFFHLTEQLNPKGALFFHKYAKPSHPIFHNYKTKHNWTVYHEVV